VASHAAEEPAQLERERDVQRKKMRRVINREMAVAWKEKEVDLKERTAHHKIDGAKATAKMIDNKRAAL
jgi:hypothetical protein